MDLTCLWMENINTLYNLNIGHAGSDKQNKQVYTWTVASYIFRDLVSSNTSWVLLLSYSEYICFDLSKSSYPNDMDLL